MNEACAGRWHTKSAPMNGVGAGRWPIWACTVRRPDAILAGMTSETPRIPAKPSLDGLEDKWTQRWAKERVVQV